jgi:hypothetical protein
MEGFRFVGAAGTPQRGRFARGEASGHRQIAGVMRCAMCIGAQATNPPPPPGLRRGAVLPPRLVSARAFRATAARSVLPPVTLLSRTWACCCCYAW